MRRPHPAILLLLFLAVPASRSESPRPGPKVPVALAWGRDGSLIVAQREAKSLAVVDPGNWSIREEWPLGIRPNSLAVNDEGLVLVGGCDGETLVVGERGRIVSQLPPGRGRTQVVPLSEGRLATASVWDPRVRIAEAGSGKVVAEHGVSVSPGALAALPDGSLLVADAFVGRLETLRPGEAGSERAWGLGAVNLRALAVSPGAGEVLFVGAASSGPPQVTRTNIDWGLVLSSKLGAIRLDQLAEEGSDRRLEPRRLTLDGSSNGAADPTAIGVSPDEGKIYVALSGAHQVLLVDRSLGVSTGSGRPPLGNSLRLKTREVGLSPSAIALDPSGRFVVTADSMSDTLSVLRADTLEPATTLALGPPDVERPPALRGEAAFRDGRASLDRWMSCASCHPDGHTNGLSFDTLGDGTYGQPKNTPSLLGVGPTAPFAWTGRFPTLEAQVEQSLRSSLHGPPPTEERSAEIAAYLRTLSPPPPQRQADDPAALRGAEVFQARRCDTCHRPPTYTSRPIRNPWSDEPNEAGYSPPSLRGVGRTAPYFHDGRAPTLADALSIHNPGSDQPLSPSDRDALITFLESL